MVTTSKTCTGCKRRKVLGEFSPSRSRCKACRRTPGSKGVEMVSAVPFAAWLESIMLRDDASRKETAIRLGIADRMFRMVLNGEQARVQLDTVERALFADDVLTLREVYPALYDLEAA